mmetsp:Transcript_21851/g.24924  ORF Transcript_21851/g.24924 Transcript_21851/m.24924 type:complete len:433 (+) Transcript_21851:147-1445(+)|eukprot:CAMPEP_0194138862 /NCGR_PEP_ID=MMETSP0152-20130528/8604_1 /TAXON_ID=1049557 /ORGANISM="Thalassiothrix antarctica, Strain L6-D1" /LENGTH=432 /DNA_ID=CAMNT_0038836483 /DNA_START=85 /DNA_END=1383 /DNA_ORIENTATION=-
MMEQQALRFFTQLYCRALKSTSCLTASFVAAGGVLMLDSSSSSKRFSSKKESNTIIIKQSSLLNNGLFKMLLFEKLSLSTLIASSNCESNNDPFSESYRFTQCLAYHRSMIDDYRQRWTYSADSQKTPIKAATAWPSTSEIPKTKKEIAALEYDFKFATPGTYRDDVQFRLAYYYLDVEPSKAFALLQELAVRGTHADAMCLFGIVWNEGSCNVEADPAKACVWFAQAADLDHAQACYELAVSLYTGEGVAENETKAVEWFERAASMGHAAAAYMLGDCLLDGVGIVRDRAEALEWLVASGEMGHRGARSRVLAVLEQEEWKDYGEFTDSSRQTFKRKIEADLEYRKWTEEDLEKIVSIERQFTIGGGSGNPVVLERRRSVIAESREREDQEQQQPLVSSKEKKKEERNINDNSESSPTAKDYVQKQLETKS